MTRLQYHRVRQAKFRASQDRLETALDNVIPSLGILPSEAFEAVVVYAMDGLVAQGTVCTRDEALSFVSRALTKRGIIE